MPHVGVDLDKSERDLLLWLAKEDFSQYGECDGHALDGLIAKGLAQVHEGREYQERAGFIAKGDGPKYRAVSLTPRGYVVAIEQGHDEP